MILSFLAEVTGLIMSVKSNSNLFIQGLRLDKYDVGSSDVTQCTFIERLDLNSPKLIIKLSDPYRVYQDEYKISVGSQVKVWLGDPDGQGQELFKLDFTAISAYAKEDAYFIEALQDDIFYLKKQLSNAVFFVSKTIKQVLKECFPNIDKFDVEEGINDLITYHCNPSSTYSTALKEIELTLGIKIWFCRGTIVIKRLESIEDSKPKLRVEYRGNDLASIRCTGYKVYKNHKHTERNQFRNYSVWNHFGGVIKETTKYQPCLIPYGNKSTLTNRNKAFVSLMELAAQGDGRLIAGKKIELGLNKMVSGQAIDESVPKNQVITGVRHFQHKLTYSCVIEAGELKIG